MFKLLILTEAGDSIGYGHFTRCNAIREELIEHGGDCEIVMEHRGKPSSSIEDSVTIYPWHKNNPDLIAKITTDAVLIDSYLATCDRLKALAQQYKMTVCVDDYNRLSYPCDLVINPNIFGDQIDYGNQNSKLMAGREAVILRQGITSARRKEIHNDDLRLIAITLGGSDHRNLLQSIIPLLQDEFLLNIFAGNEVTVEKLSKFANSATTVHGFLEASEMADQFTQSDMVISAGGQTLHELAFLSVPVVAIETGTDQTNNIMCYQNAGFLVNPMKWNDENLLTNIKKAVYSMKSHPYRVELARAGSHLHDGKGAGRILQAIAELLMA